MEELSRVLRSDDPFPFSCHKGLNCFTSCCADINIYLTPNDVMHLKNGLNLTAQEFFAGYASTYVVKRTGMPLVRLKMRSDEELTCPLVRRDGCIVYPHRPWACRMYPLEKTGGRYRLLVDTSRCHGLLENEPKTVEEWLASQGVPEYEAMDALYAVVTLADPTTFLKDVSQKVVRRLYRLCYDLDEFRGIMVQKGLMEALPKSGKILEGAKDSDLLILSFKLLKWVLLGGLDDGARKTLMKGLEGAL